MCQVDPLLPCAWSPLEGHVREWLLACGDIVPSSFDPWLVFLGDLFGTRRTLFSGIPVHILLLWCIGGSPSLLGSSPFSSGKPLMAVYIYILSMLFYLGPGPDLSSSVGIETPLSFVGQVGFFCVYLFLSFAYWLSRRSSRSCLFYSSLSRHTLCLNLLKTLICGRGEGLESSEARAKGPELAAPDFKPIREVVRIVYH
ncbi:hypothetical protein B0H13DRAFT_2017261 [Mycena leptocephala]|nr:hypothetical protein B0H13DRAFT_2017261 [Mycena leptocephala]